jgi:diguanylate cyclase (GGDEF)-like protein
MNTIAEKMTGWQQAAAEGKHITQIMQLCDEESKPPCTNPVLIALAERLVVAMALNCELVHASTGEATPIEDSAAPIFDMDGVMLGAIIVFHDVSQAKALAMKMSFLANHDQLTGLPNRILLRDRIQQACRLATMIERQVGIILLDIDQFKYLNDSLGHQLGDELLNLLVKRLQSVLEAEQTLARVGGDEFVLIFPDIQHIEQISNLAQSIIRIMRQPFDVKGNKCSMSLSMGIALYPTDSDSEEELMRHADVALFKAKTEGRNRFCFFSDELGQRMLVRHRQEQDLREAIEHKRLEVHFQPKVALEDGHITGAEALVRMRAADGRLIPPSDFIALAEETGLIIPLGRFVLIQSCLQASRWRDAGMSIPVSVNIAAAQFTDPSLMTMIEQLLLEFNLPAQLLELEVTETALIQDPERTAQTLQKFRALGISIAIDDFGTGYSSLSYLKRFEIDVLKIDISFVKDMLVDKNDYEIVKTIISLGRSMNYALIAEGIETEEHQTRLLQLGCYFGQGYYYSKPLPADQFFQLIQARLH